MKTLVRAAVWAAGVLAALSSGCERAINSAGEELIQTRLVSRTTSGVQAFGTTPNLSSNPAISGNGKYVAFVSRAANLDPTKTSNTFDIFRHDLDTHETIRVSLSTTGGDPDGNSSEISISFDGNRICYTSGATNLHADDAAIDPSIFVRDVLAGTTYLVSRATGPSGANGNNTSTSGKISADGKSVAFTSSANNLASVGASPSPHIYVRRLSDYPGTPDTTILVSRATDTGVPGAFGDNASLESAITPDGRFVAFSSFASNLDSLLPDTNGTMDIYLRDTVGPPAGLPTTIRVSLTAAGAQLDGDCRFPCISSDTNFIAFVSQATNAVPNDINGSPDVFRKDVSTGELIIASVTSAGGPSTGASDVTMSADGRFIAFTSSAALIPSDTNGLQDVYRRDLVTDELIRISLRTHGEQGNGNSDFPSISDDGQRVVFRSDASNLIDVDANGVMDVFVRGHFTKP